MNDLMNYVSYEILNVFRVLVWLYDLWEQYACFDLNIHHVQEEVQLWEQLFLAIGVLYTALEKEVYDLLEKIIVEKLFVDESLQKNIDEIIHKVDMSYHVLKSS